MALAHPPLIVRRRVSDLANVRIPILYLPLETPDGSLRFEPLEPLIDLFRKEPTWSMTTRNHVVRGVALFIAYVDHRWPNLNGRLDSLKKREVREAFDGFCNHLRTGTRDIDVSGSTSTLGWPARSRDVTLNLIRGLEKYLTFVAERLDMDSAAIEATGVPVRKAGAFRPYARTFSMLGNLKLPPPKDAIALGRGSFERNSRSLSSTYTNRFPIHLLGDLLTEGGTIGKLPWEQEPCPTGHLHRILLAAAGIRASESLQAWVGDITVAPSGKPVGFLRHPRFHEERDADGPCTREELLSRRYGLEVRRSGNGRFAAGWKSPRLDRAHSSPMYWAPYPGIEELLAATLYRYLTEVRPEIMLRRRAAGLGDHPYLLVCTRSTTIKGSTTTKDRLDVGQPYTVAAMNASWKGAIGRLSRRTGADLRVSKHDGTTIHALRHLYGNTLKCCGFDEPTIQDYMHHVSILSSRAYTRSDAEEANKQLEAAREFIRAGRIDGINIQFPSIGNLIERHFRPHGPWPRSH